MSAKNSPSASSAEGAAQTATVEMAEGVVARGHTVIVDGALKGPGEKIVVSAVDARSLLETGYLVDPKATEIPVQKGPKLIPSDGPSMVRLA